MKSNAATSVADAGGPRESVGQRILEAIDTLTPAERRIARALIDGYPALATRTASAIGEASGTSAASVVRLVSKLGFDSLGAFHDAVRGEMVARTRSPFRLDAAPGADSLVESVIATESANIAATLRRLRPGALDAIAALIERAGTVATLGGRFSGALATYLAAHLQLLRGGVVSLSPSLGLADQLAHADRGTCLIVFDFRRYEPEASFAARHVKLRRGRVIAVTDPYLSPAAQSADRTLVVDIEGPHLADSYAAAMALLDTIVGHLIARDPERSSSRLAEVEATRLMHRSALAGET